MLPFDVMVYVRNEREIAEWLRLNYSTNWKEMAVFVSNQLKEINDDNTRVKLIIAYHLANKQQ